MEREPQEKSHLGSKQSDMAEKIASEIGCQYSISGGGTVIYHIPHDSLMLYLEKHKK